MKNEAPKPHRFEKVYSPAEAAGVLGIPLRKMYRLIRMGAIAYIDILNGRADCARIKESDLIQWIESHTVKPIERPERSPNKKPAPAAYVPLTQLLREGAFGDGRKN